LRLHSVLGKRPEGDARGGAEKAPLPPAEGAPAAASAARALDAAPVPVPEKTVSDLRLMFGPLYNPGLARFLGGAKRAYGMILAAFWKGDMADAAAFIDEGVLRDFEAAITERARRGEKVENRLIEVAEVRVVDARIKNHVGEITLGFASDIVAIVRDASGRLVEGDLADTVRVHDEWTFARNLKSKDPNWTLVATRAG
ncbi:MAG TPA: Tim44/TimA family putative adaptor protein, partial [Sphingomonadales bacterium]|nr:Tim44/TimA family putative adaptor protein [Sphingomonadales bacterium]